jgi:ribosomal protein S27AE
MTALLLGTALAVASLCYVLYPLYRDGISAGPRVCERCGPRPEKDAKFCSNCGAALIS